MKILALDSTAVVASVAVCEDEQMLASFTINGGNTHSETLLPMIEASLKLLHITPDNNSIDLFACSEGPGSFTGVRIGAATIKGLAFGKNKACIGVSSLEALAFNLRGFDGILCPVMNARRNQVYNALFECHGSQVTRLTEDRAIAASDLENELLSYKEKIYINGDGAFLMKSSYAYVPEILKYQNGYSVAVCALDKYKNGKCGDDLSLSPSYLRPSQAERERNEKSNQGE